MLNFDGNIGKYVIAAGIFVVLLGLVIYFFNNKLNWIGRLPGDIRIERENFRFYFPVTTMIIASLLLNLLFWIVKRYF